MICRAKGPRAKQDVPNERKVWYAKTGTTYVNIVSPIASHGSEKHSSPIQPPKLQNPATSGLLSYSGTGKLKTYPVSRAGILAGRLRKSLDRWFAGRFHLPNLGSMVSPEVYIKDCKEW